MLNEILAEFRKTKSPLDLKELSRKLDVEYSALEGMLQTLVRQGKLREISLGSETCADCSRSSDCAQLKTGVAGGTVYELPKKSG
jgi:hypothetical protein